MPSQQEVEKARKESDDFIIGAEKFKATVCQPLSGNNGSNSDEINHNLRLQFSESRIEQMFQFFKDNQDDEFYQVTCHVDVKLKQKIQKGEYVELEALIPKSRGQTLKEDDRLQQFVMQAGTTYWAPPEKENKITSVCKWEQAFRVFAAIYCETQPCRSVEIWEYIHTINYATVSFPWENVYYYDMTFRQLMSNKPSRSWAKMHSQLWQAAMCDPLPKGSVSATGNAQRGKHVDWKDCCCW